MGFRTRGSRFGIRRGRPSQARPMAAERRGGPGPRARTWLGWAAAVLGVGVVVFLIWLWISNIAILFGAEFNAELERGRRIEAIGFDLSAAQADIVIDARGCAVLPGFVQTHVHLCQTLFRGAADDLALLDWLKRRVWPLEAPTAASFKASRRPTRK